MHDDTPKHPGSGSRLQFSDPRIQAIADRAARAAELAVERVAANAMDPNTYPLPRDPRSLERLLKSVIDSLPAVKRQEIFARAQPGVRASAAARRSRFGDLAAVDLRASPSVTEQVRAIALPPNLRIPDRELPALAEKLKRQFFPPIITQPTAAATATKMDLFVTSATCSEPTAHESGADEIVATGILINEQGVVSNTNAIELGQFNAGTSRAFNNLSLRRLRSVHRRVPQARRLCSHSAREGSRQAGQCACRNRCRALYDRLCRGHGRADHRQSDRVADRRAGRGPRRAAHRFSRCCCSTRSL